MNYEFFCPHCGSTFAQNHTGRVCPNCDGEMVQNKGSDVVSHPNHYCDGKIECLDYIEDKLTEEEYRGYIKGNVLKYVTRERLKNGTEDLKKARFYLDRLIERETKDE